MTELADMMVYFNKKLEFYNEQFGRSKYPSKPTLSRILNMVDGEAVGKIIVQVIHEIGDNLGEIIAIDEKAIPLPKSTCEKIVDKGVDYAFGVKGSQEATNI